MQTQDFTNNLFAFMEETLSPSITAFTWIEVTRSSKLLIRSRRSKHPSLLAGSVLRWQPRSPMSFFTSRHGNGMPCTRSTSQGELSIERLELKRVLLVNMKRMLVVF